MVRDIGSQKIFPLFLAVFVREGFYPDLQDTDPACVQLRDIENLGLYLTAVPFPPERGGECLTS